MPWKDLKKVPCIAWCLAINALLFVGWHVYAPTFLYSDNSPHMTYRVDVYNASILQRIIHYNFGMPAIVRLYRVEPRALLAESHVVDMSAGNGSISWHTAPPLDFNEVYAGHGVLFENIPSECPTQAPPPSCPNRPETESR
ncbi:hypothetical protein [Acidovorax sp. BLS4]|uniref:hypothetical protein n=1 Tax=Acidovorax sp. BLS4 TaxID=3273430 RepID=UPI0029434F49|nr:hypothetical protein [Paracidovorax avenae]WOI47914.1 hypothetical protein R1Z03_12155 [Paracidovorax avenae]